ncbi:MAG: S8 family serine peptidase [Pseudomonadota bacterium]
MRKKFLITIGLVWFFFLISFQVQANPKIDPFFQTITSSQPSLSFKAQNLEQPKVEVFIKTSDLETTAGFIAELGGEVKLKLGQIITATIPLEAIEEISAQEQVVYIEAAKPVQPKLDLALQDVDGYAVHEGLELPSAYTGANTIVGIVDTGLDYDHADFLDEAGNSRVLYIWHQRSTSGRGPAEISSTYGMECDTDSISTGTCFVNDVSGHGTHVTGIAASSDATYTGVAPDASIISVIYKSELQIDDSYAIPLFSTTICEAAYYIFAKAKALNMPAVVNLSLGTHLGAHDGTSLFEECLDELVEGTSGRAIVAAAGNENSDNNYFTGLHAGYAVSSLSATNFEIKNFESGRVFYIDIWGREDSELNFGLAIKQGRTNQVMSRSNMVSPGAATEGTFAKGQIAYQINASQTQNPLNNKPHVGITLVFDEEMDDPQGYSFDLLVSGQGYFDAWLYPDKPADVVNFTSYADDDGLEWNYIPGDRQMSVAIPATAKNVIGVGAYTTKNIWECCRIDYDLGDILEFSSVGPSANPNYTGVKPEIVAPGAMIASSKSAQASIDKQLLTSDKAHFLMAGSSMAAPFVSGTIALMFSANPALTHEDVERYLVESAYVDEKVGQTPNSVWGYGKLDVLKAVQAAVKGGASSGSQNGNVSYVPNLPSSYTNTAGGCEFVGQGRCGSVLMMISFLICLLTMLSLRGALRLCSGRRSNPV